MCVHSSVGMLKENSYVVFWFTILKLYHIAISEWDDIELPFTIFPRTPLEPIPRV